MEKKISANVALNTKLTQVFMSDRIGADLNHAFLEAIVGEVSTKITHTVLNKEIPFDINIGELASARVQYEGEGDYGSVSGMPRASPPITRRILQNGVMRASLQIPEGTPGIVFIWGCCNFTPKPTPTEKQTPGNGSARYETIRSKTTASYALASDGMGYW